MVRCSLVQVGLSQASRAVAIVPMLKQNGRNADAQSRASGSVHSTAATQGTTLLFVFSKNCGFPSNVVLFRDGAVFVLAPAPRLEVAKRGVEMEG